MKSNKLIILIVAFFVMFSQYSLSDETSRKPLAAVLQDSVWSVIDYNGKTIFKDPKITDVLGYSEGAIRVKMKYDTLKFWAFLDDEGKVLFYPNSQLVYDFSDGMALSTRHNAWSRSLEIFGYYDKLGREVVPHIYDDATDFKEGLAYVMNKDTSAYIDKFGNVVIPMKDMAGNSFSEGLADVNNKDGKIGFMEKDGKIRIDFSFDEVRPVKESKAIFNRYGRFGFIDTSGKVIAKPIFDFAESFSEGFAFIGFAEDTLFTPKWGFINSECKLVGNVIYSDQHSFSEGLAAVKLKNKWGFIDYKAKEVIPFEYDLVSSFKNGVAWVLSKDKKVFAFINKNGETVVDLTNAKRVFDLRWNKRVK
jgi:hypothetical protein